MIFWRPKGRRLSIYDLKDGMHVEGYYKHQFDSMWKKMKEGTVSIKPYSRERDYGWTIVEILVRGQMSPMRVGINYGKDEPFRDGSTQVRLYDGLVYTKRRKRRFP